MKSRNYLFIPVLFFFIITSCQEKEIVCKISGTVIDRDSDTILIHNGIEDLRFYSDYIPIIDGKFEYELTINEVVAYNLAFQDELMKGSWRPIVIFPEKGEIYLTLYPMDRYKENQIEGGELNLQYENFLNQNRDLFEHRGNLVNESRNELRESGEWYTEEYQSILDQARNEKDRTKKDELYRTLGDIRNKEIYLSEKAKGIDSLSWAIQAEYIRWKYDYYHLNQDLVSYYELLKTIRGIESEDESFQEVFNIFQLYANTFPDHYYTIKGQEWLNAKIGIVVGEEFVDFTAKDLQGNSYTVSEILPNYKYTLLDMWASWCGPCIRNSKNMIPIFEEYKGKGFNVIGIAREFENTDAMSKAIDKHDFTWINLLELDDEQNLWFRYNLGSGGGGTFLLDNKGEIVLINPTAEDVKQLLEKEL